MREYLQDRRALKRIDRIKIMEQLLQKLSESKLVRITGSYADGTQTSNSDIDFYIKPDHPDYKIRGDKRNIEKIKEILDEFKVSVESNMVGYWFTHTVKNNIPLNLEFSDLFRPRERKLKDVIIKGIRFKTY